MANQEGRKTIAGAALAFPSEEVTSARVYEDPNIDEEATDEEESKETKQAEGHDLDSSDKMQLMNMLPDVCVAVCKYIRAVYAHVITDSKLSTQPDEAIEMMIARVGGQIHLLKALEAEAQVEQICSLPDQQDNLKLWITSEHLRIYETYTKTNRTKEFHLRMVRQYASRCIGIKEDQFDSGLEEILANPEQFHIDAAQKSDMLDLLMVFEQTIIKYLDQLFQNVVSHDQNVMLAVNIIMRMKEQWKNADFKKLYIQPAPSAEICKVAIDKILLAFGVEWKELVPILRFREASVPQSNELE